MSSVVMVLMVGLGMARLPGLTETAAPGVDTSTSTLTIATCPYASSLQSRHSGTYNMDYLWLDWSTYDGGCPHPVPHDYTAVVVENPCLQLTFLPELGGRLYGVTVKATGEELLYQNPVVKPTHWGPPEQGWWLAAGGIEWCLPVDEHGYEWGVPWSYDVTTTAAGVTVSLWDTAAADRVRARISVFLPADQAAFQITPRLENPTASPVSLKFWDNAMLAPGPANTVRGRLRFVLPIDRVTVHSTGNGSLPGPGQTMSWPLYNGIDYSLLGNWDQWLGFFARPRATQDWVGVYAEGVRRGVARIFPHEIAVGVKGFGFGWDHPIAADTWTNNGSTYVELHGGPSPTYWDAITLGAGQSLQWTETWLPLRDLPALSLATADVALGVSAQDSDLELGVEMARQSANVGVRLWRRENCEPLWRVDGLNLAPGEAYTHHVADLGLGPEAVVLGIVEQGRLLAASGPLTCPLPRSQVDLMVSVQTDKQFDVTWSDVDPAGVAAAYDIQVRDGDADASWADWLTDTTGNSAQFEGEDGHTYTFRSRVRDLFGNVEPWPDGDWQDTFTTVLLEPAPEFITSDKSASSRCVQPGQVVTFEIDLVNSGNLAASVQVTDPLPAGLSLASVRLVGPPGLPAPDVVSDTLAWEGSVFPGAQGVSILLATEVLTLPQSARISNLAWIDDGVHPALVREATLNRCWDVYLPMIMRSAAAGG